MIDLSQFASNKEILCSVILYKITIDVTWT